MEVFATNTDLALLVLRLALGVVFLAHGPIKFVQTQAFAAGLGLTENQVRGIGALETLGAAAVILGAWEQVGAIFLMIVMLGAIYFKTQKWGKAFTGDGGWEFEFMLLAAALVVLLAGGGDYVLVR